MRFLKFFSILMSLFVINSVQATEYEFVGTDNTLSTKICLAAVTNDKASLRLNIQRTGYSTGIMANKVKCNDTNVANFARQYGAMDTYLYLDKKTYQRNRAKTDVTIRDLAINSSNAKKVVVYVASR